MSKSEEFNKILSNVEPGLLYNTSEVKSRVESYVNSLLESLELPSMKSVVDVDYDGQVVVSIYDEELEDASLSFTIVEDENNDTYIAILGEDDDTTTLIDVEESLWWTTVRKLSGKPTYSDITRLITGELLEDLLCHGVFMEDEENMSEKVVTSVRGGKVVRRNVRTVKKRRTPAQRMALTKARKKSHTSSAKRSRKVSMKVRKMRSLTPRNPSLHKKPTTYKHVASRNPALHR